MANYEVYTQNDLAKWWFTQAGSGGRLSDLIDDQPLGPAIQQASGSALWGQWGGQVPNEWAIIQTTKPDSVWENLAGWRMMTNVADNTAEGALNADEWTWYTDGYTVIRLSDSSDANDTDMREYYAWDGAGAGPAFMTEIIEDAIYRIHIPFDIGDGATSTTLTSIRECVYFDDTTYFLIKASAGLTIGEKIGDWGTNGSYWDISGPDGASIAIIYAATASFKAYASKLHCRSNTQYNFGLGTVEILNTTLSMTEKVITSWRKCWCFLNLASGIFKDVFHTNVYAAKFQATHTIEDFHVHNSNRGIWGQAVGIEIFNALSTSALWDEVYNQSTNNTIKVIDSKQSITDVTNVTDETNIIYEAYTVNITIADKTGTGIVGATVLCESSDSGSASTEYDVEEFSEDTGASGVLAEQTVTAKKWVGTSETLTNYNYFRFTISEPGYETLIKKLITVDDPIVWRLELQPAHGTWSKTWR